MKNVTLITGASSGLGLEFAKQLAKKKHDLLLVARNTTKLEEIQQELTEKYNISVYIYAQDLAKDNAAKPIYEYVKENNLFVNVLINNAGFGDYGEFANANLKKQNDMIHVNVISLVELTHYCLQDMLKYDEGKILNLCSMASFQPGPLMSVYYATKAFVLSLTEALSVELENTNITISALCPGPTATGFEKNANLKNSGLFINLNVAKAKDVVLYGIKALQKKQVIAIPGVTNKIAITMSKLAPRKLVRKFVYSIQKERK